ncbi:MAG: N-acetylmuramoyl-L-alanine amidase, partial [Hyphomicrobiales bacterium]
TVVIDPGHGGIDTGARGRNGTLEKDINLLFALALRDRLKSEGHLKVIMTREDDRFISLGERSAIARRAKANLFISMHADSIRYSDIRGATVYTLSGRASDALSSEVAESENSSDRFVNPEWQKNEPEVFDILIELMRRETDSFSEHFAAGLVQELGRHKIRLIRNPKRSAGFKVLMAPDVPSVLVEIGYLSNIDDEKLLVDESWRKDTADAVGSAVADFFRLKQASDKAARD